MKSKGFTLIELIIVVIIIGILATIAIPQYLSAVQRAQEGKARHAIGLIVSAEKMYYAENNTFVGFADGGANAVLGSFIEMGDVDADQKWAYVASGSTTAFGVNATGPGNCIVGVVGSLNGTSWVTPSNCKSKNP